MCAAPSLSAPEETYLQRCTCPSVAASVLPAGGRALYGLFRATAVVLARLLQTTRTSLPAKISGHRGSRCHPRFSGHQAPRTHRELLSRLRRVYFQAGGAATSLVVQRLTCSCPWSPCAVMRQACCAAWCSRTSCADLNLPAVAFNLLVAPGPAPAFQMERRRSRVSARSLVSVRTHVCILCSTGGPEQPAPFAGAQQLRLERHAFGAIGASARHLLPAGPPACSWPDQDELQQAPRVISQLLGRLHVPCRGTALHVGPHSFAAQVLLPLGRLASLAATRTIETRRFCDGPLPAARSALRRRGFRHAGFCEFLWHR